MLLPVFFNGYLDVEAALAPQHRRQLTFTADPVAGVFATGRAVVEFVFVAGHNGVNMPLASQFSSEAIVTFIR
ncbi:MAG: hypothetical protein H7Z12_06255 [Rhodospirillaceae bacterium]|nr:hypothetical protein [Rhodospirillales bacterium]